ncbi:stress response protein NST1-like isoform X2 [Andrographis paniculata]|uniref:stress response protein NST1-like isoform X2 n=1 Tax=Andrographis paniculata TaxID=175694 RepID=UPI0021E6FCB3|nr:stress response protein NST1-like isoform X2 [Andrographis paniculata]
MSRCFPYPLPGYALGGASHEALIESIKLRKRENAKQKKKEKKTYKKGEEEKRKDRKERKERKRKSEDKTCQGREKSNTPQSHIDKKLSANVKGDLLPSGSKTEPEQLERSTLTEEHGQSVHLHAPSTSSDSTENSNKRKRPSSPMDVPNVRGKIIRIRLSSKKQNESNVSSLGEPQLCSTSGQAESISHDNSKTALRYPGAISCNTTNQTDSIPQGPLQRSNQKEICSTSRPTSTLAPVGTRIPPTTTTATPKLHKMELKLKNIMENWFPPRLEDVPQDLDDQDWLFGRKKCIPTEKRQKPVIPSVPCSSDAALWPRAQHLPEVDIYALPFTVPF